MKKNIFTILAICLLFFGISTDIYGQDFRMSRCQNTRTYGVQDRNGAWVIEPRYDRHYYLSHVRNVRLVRYNGKWGVVDLSTGKEVIACQFEEIGRNLISNVVAARLNGRWGYIHISGTVIVPFVYPSQRAAWRSNRRLVSSPRAVTEEIEREITREIEREIEQLQRAEREYTANSFNTFAHQYVERNISQWQLRGEFERLEDWKQRVSESGRQAKVLELLREAEQTFIEERSHNFLTGATLGAYNPDNEMFSLQTNLHGTLQIPVSINEGQNFRNNWNSHLRMPRFMIHNDRLAFSGVTFIATDGTINYYNFSNPVEINISEYSIAALQNERNRNISIAANVAAVNVVPDTQIVHNVPVEQQGRQGISAQQRSFQQGDFAIGARLAIHPGALTPTFGIGTTIRYNITTPTRLEGAFFYFLPRNMNFWGVDVTVSMWNLSANIHYLFAVSENVTLYMLTGASVWGLNIGVSAGHLYGEGSGTLVGLNLGGGIDIRLSNHISLNLEPKPMLLFDLRNDNTDVDFMISAGIIFRF